MPSDLHALLHDAAREPRQPLDTGTIRDRAQRSRRLEIARGVVAVLALIAGIIGITSWATQPPEQPVIAPVPGAPASPEPSEETDQEDTTIGVHDVTFTDGTLTVDFDFPPTGVGNYSTSAGSMLWHNLITANLLQLDGAAQIELLADGTCDGYSGAFEGRGCVVVDRASAPWNR